MALFKVVGFVRWQQKQQLSDAVLCAAVEEMRQGLIDADLGGGVVKKRIARPGGGKRGGYRTLLATNKQDKWFFLYGFAKNERDDLPPQDLRALKAFARELLALDERKLRRAMASGDLQEISYGQITFAH